MKTKLMIATVVGALTLGSGLVFAGFATSTNRSPASDTSPEAAAGYVCPATGETLPCPNCCPLEGLKERP